MTDADPIPFQRVDRRIGWCYLVVKQDETDPYYSRHTGHPTRLHFAIYSVMGYDEATGSCSLEAWHEDGYNLPVDTPEEAAEVITGTIKWDGCCDWSTGDDMQAHTCWAEQMGDYADALRAVYEIAAPIITVGD